MKNLLVMRMIRKGTALGLEVNLEFKEDGIIGMMPVFETLEQAKKYFGDDVKVQEITIERKDGAQDV